MKSENVTLNSWYERLRSVVLRSREPASRSYRYMSRLIEQEFSRDGTGVCLAFSSPDNNKVSTDALLMLAYCLQSELDSRVLIIDARLTDLSGGITGRLGFAGMPGYADMLRDTSQDKARLIRQTTVANVEVLPAGSAGDSGATNIDRDRLSALLEGMRAQYGHVLLQAGSVLGDTRNLLTVAQADIVFLLAEENRTRLKPLDDCQKLLLNNGVRDVRIVITGEKP